VAVGVAVGLPVGEGVGDSDGVGVGLPDGLGLGDSTVKVKVSWVQALVAHVLMSVVHVPPTAGQQYCSPPQDSTLPAALQRLSSEVPSDSGGVQLRSTPSDPGHCSVQVVAAPGVLSGAVGATDCCLS